MDILSPDLSAYDAGFLVAAAFALAAVPVALSINDADAAQTMVDPRKRRDAPSVQPGVAHPS